MKTLQRCHYEFLSQLIVAMSTTLLFWFTNLDQWAAALFFYPEAIGDVWPKQHEGLWKILYDYAFPFTMTAGVGTARRTWLPKSDQIELQAEANKIF